MEEISAIKMKLYTWMSENAAPEFLAPEKAMRDYERCEKKETAQKKRDQQQANCKPEDVMKSESRKCRNDWKPHSDSKHHREPDHEKRGVDHEAETGKPAKHPKGFFTTRNWRKQRVSSHWIS